MTETGSPVADDSKRVSRPQDPRAVQTEPDASIEIALEAIEAAESPAVPLLESAADELPGTEAAPLLEAARFLRLPDAPGLLDGKAAMPLPRESGDRTSPGARKKILKRRPTEPSTRFPSKRTTRRFSSPNVHPASGGEPISLMARNGFPPSRDRNGWHRPAEEAHHRSEGGASSSRWMASAPP